MVQATSLQDFAQKEIATGLKKLQDAGIDPGRWLAMLDADELTMQHLAAAWPSADVTESDEALGIVYDAVSLLGFGLPSSEPLPEAKSDEMVIHYGGWSLQDLRDCDIGRQLMSQEDWYNSYDWSSEKLPVGIYRLRMWIPGSKNKYLIDCKRMFSQGEEYVPVVLSASALLAHRKQTGKDLLKGDWTDCKEYIDSASRIKLGWRDGRLCVHHGLLY